MFHKKGDLELFTFNCFNHNSGPVQAMSTRAGGVSRGAYRSLNLGFHVGDNDSSVLVNRQRFSRALPIALESFVVGQQVHGADVAVVTNRDRGRACPGVGCSPEARGAPPAATPPESSPGAGLAASGGPVVAAPAGAALTNVALPKRAK